MSNRMPNSSVCNENQNTINNALTYWDPIQELFLFTVQRKSLTVHTVHDFFKSDSDTFIDFLEQLADKYIWFDYRMTPHIIDFLKVFIDEKFSGDVVDENYEYWYQDLEHNIRYTYHIELKDLLQKIRYRINIEHFYEKGKTPEQSTKLIGVYYIKEIEELKSRRSI